MHRRAAGGRASFRHLGACLAVMLGVAACGGSSTTESPGLTGTPAATAPLASPSAVQATPAGSPSGAGTPFDPMAIAITLEPVANVDGGPLALAATPDETGRLLVAAKDGRVWILRDGSVAATPLLDIRSLVSGGSEQGLLGIAVPPTFPADPRVFVDYTDVNGDTVVASYTVAGDDPDRLDPASAVWILTVDQPFANHNGGALAFGPDGMLYVSLGDGGSGGDPLGSGQRTDTLLGKILRLDVRPSASATAPYAIPPDNPLVGKTDARPEIWQYGLRNPWRFSFDRATGDLWIGDVGQDKWEEVDVARGDAGGLNFGWNFTEGRHCYSPRVDCPTRGITQPVTEYGHDQGCAVIGGDVYRGTKQPLLAGGYVFADECSGQLWAIAAATDGPVDPVNVGTAGAGVAGFGEDAAGEVYAANLGGTISRLVAAAR